MKQTIKHILSRIDDPLVIYTTVMSILDPRVLTQLTASDNVHVRRALACTPRVPKKVLTRLVNDTDVTVKKFVASNTKCPLKQLKKYLNDTSPVVVKAAADALMKRKIRVQQEDMQRVVRKLLAKRKS